MEGTFEIARGFLERVANSIVRDCDEPVSESGGRGDPVRRYRVADATFQILQFIDVQAQRRRRIRRPHRGTRPVQRAEQRVVVALADRIELVVVATRARDRQALESLRNDIDLVVGPLDAFLPWIHGLVSQFDEPQVGGAEN